MQNLISIVATEPKAINTQKSSKGTDSSKAEANSKDFVAILFDQIKSNIKNPVKINDKVSSKIQVNLDSLLKSDKKKSSNELLLGEVLGMLSLLKNNNENISFPKFSDKLDKIINNKVAINEFKDAKNIADLIKLSKKYSLGLENIKFSKKDIQALQKKFPKLAAKDFFKIKDDLQIDTASQNKIPTKNKKTIIIENLINNLSKDITKKEDNPKNILQSLLKNIDKNSKKVIVKTNEEDKKNKVEAFIKKDEKANKKVDVKSAEITKIPAKQVEKMIGVKNIEITKAPISKVEKSASKTIGQKDLSVLVSNKKEKTTLKDKILNKNVESQDYKDVTNKTELLVKNIKNQTVKVKEKIDVSSVKIEKNTNLDNTQNISAKLDKENDPKKDQKEIKHDPIVHKTEVKTNAKTEILKTDKSITPRSSLNQFANDLREKIGNYKSPIMKLQMALNPKNLGEVEVTLLNRGNNLHVNITSNTNAMSLFTQNQAEFKNSLVNMGFTNLEMNFSDQGKSNQQQNQQQNQHNFESTVELIVPQYI